MSLPDALLQYGVMSGGMGWGGGR